MVQASRLQRDLQHKDKMTLWACTSVSVNEHVSMCVCTCASVCGCVCAHVCVSVCMCSCMCACVHVRVLVLTAAG